MRVARVVQVYAALISCFLLVDCQLQGELFGRLQDQNEVVYTVPVRIPNRQDHQNKKYAYLILFGAIVGRAAMSNMAPRAATVHNGGDGGGGSGGGGPVPTG